jgi:hypothetical protein
MILYIYTYEIAIKRLAKLKYVVIDCCLVFDFVDFRVVARASIES